jgi:hypothetical protein
MVRGIFYIEEQKFIEPPNKIAFFALAEEDAVFWEQVLEKLERCTRVSPALSSGGSLRPRTA